MAALEASLRRTLPEDYREFLKISNGAEGPLGPAAYLSLWPADEIEQANLGYGSEEFAPGLLLFGTDGGGIGYGFDFRNESPSVVAIPLETMDFGDARIVGKSFKEFLGANAGQQSD